MIPEEQSERIHEERFLNPKAPGMKRYAVPEPIDATAMRPPERCCRSRGMRKLPGGNHECYEIH